MIKLKSILAIVIILITTNACKKEGIGGKATITGYVKHHEVYIPSSTVYIKYGATELPGILSADYDDQTIASSVDGHYEFTELNKGDYYLYSTGYDSTIYSDVSGGTPITIKKKAETIEINIPVTE